MRKALLLISIVLLFAVAVELPESVTGFFVTVTTSIFSIVKEVIKQILLAIANML